MLKSKITVGEMGMAFAG